jgi:hypothetical protein
MIEMKTIAILGSGPAGLMAAHAVGLCGRPLSLHSRLEKSVLGGAQYLHYPIPQLTGPNPERIITNRLYGTAEGYQAKVYGTDPNVVPSKVSAMDITDGETVGVWSLDAAYDRLWDWFGDNINPADISPEWLDDNMGNFEMVISSVPAPALCRRPDHHRFQYQEVWIQPGAPSFIPEDEVHYNGDKSPSWYRASNIGGTAGGVEWSSIGTKPPVEGLRSVRKPLRHNCDCWPDILRVGRYGTWTKGVLTHDAFYEAGRFVMGTSVDPDLGGASDVVL